MYNHCHHLHFHLTVSNVTREKVCAHEIFPQILVASLVRVASNSFMALQADVDEFLVVLENHFRYGG